MWQLLLVTVLAVLWDHFTGWRGWSVDFVLPFGALAVQCSMVVIAKVNRLEREEYLFYLGPVCGSRLYTASPSVAESGALHTAVCRLFRNQHPDAGRTVYLPEERYAAGVPEEAADVRGGQLATKVHASGSQRSSVCEGQRGEPGSRTNYSNDECMIHSESKCQMII